MRRLLILFPAALLLVSALTSTAATGRVIKVLPHFLDLEGRHALSPSLYERDAYQARLRRHPEQRSGLRFDILSRARTRNAANLKLKVEMRGIAQGNLPSERILEKDVKSGGGSRWTSIKLSSEDYQTLGEITAWRVTLWEGDQLIGEQKSFLW